MKSSKNSSVFPQKQVSGERIKTSMNCRKTEESSDQMNEYLEKYQQKNPSTFGKNISNIKQINELKTKMSSKSSSVCGQRVLKEGENRIKILDEVLNVKNFQILYSTLTDKSMRNSIRLIRVFGRPLTSPKTKANKVIFITNEDKVYVLGNNSDGSLGLESDQNIVKKPTLNKELSGKQLVDIAPGLQHCIGLTSSGQCYSWGQNTYGQLGVGNTKESKQPLLIKKLSNLTVTQISCGSYHSMALTSDGKVFIWGDNRYNLLFGTFHKKIKIPTEVEFFDQIEVTIVSISCGVSHLMALSKKGQLFVWGNNQFGQLGRNNSKNSIKETRVKPLQGFVSISEAICGPNHSLILTTDGEVYGFGLNSEGQIGIGSTDNQTVPLRLSFPLRIKDIISYYESETSIAVSMDNKCFVWGLVGKQTVLRPKAIPESPERLFDIYGKYSDIELMFETLVVNDLQSILKSGINSKPEDETKDSSVESNVDIEEHQQNNPSIITPCNSIINESVEVKSLDKALDVNLFPILSSKLSDENVRKSIRLLYVFGENGKSVIFITNEDKVYCLGSNQNGVLGLGSKEQHIQMQTLNETLSDKRVVDIRNGSEHCLALTYSKRVHTVYSWGQNQFGQLGHNFSKAVDLIPFFADKNVKQICCGAYHSMALTSDGQVFIVFQTFHS